MGRPFKARAHLYEALPGTLLSQIGRYDTTGSREPINTERLILPLTSQAAGLLLGEPGLGHDVPPQYLDHRADRIAVGQRFYYLEIPEARPQMMVMPDEDAVIRRFSEANLMVDCPHHEIRMYLFLDEETAQIIALQLRRGSSMGSILRALKTTIVPSLETLLSGEALGHTKIICGALTIEQSRGAALKLFT